MTCKTCPMHEPYRFMSRCRIKACKFFSPATENRCLLLDSDLLAEDRPVSDEDLLKYKFCDKELSVKDVGRLRKRAIERVKSTIVLHRLITVIREKYTPESGIVYVPGKHPLVDRIIGTPPLSLEIMAFDPWMLRYLLDPEFVSEVAGPRFRLKDALRLRSKEFAVFANGVKTMCTRGRI